MYFRSSLIKHVYSSGVIQLSHLFRIYFHFTLKSLLFWLNKWNNGFSGSIIWTLLTVRRRKAVNACWRYTIQVLLQGCICHWTTEKDLCNEPTCQQLCNSSRRRSYKEHCFIKFPFRAAYCFTGTLKLKRWHGENSKIRYVFSGVFLSTCLEAIIISEGGAINPQRKQITENKI